MEKPWLQSYPEEIPGTISYDIQPLHGYLEKMASRYPEKKALHFLGKDVTFSDFHDKVKKFANYLQRLGVEKGDRVAIMLPNCPQSVIGYYGTLLAGGIVVQTNPLYTERELEYQLHDSGAKVILCLDLVFPRVTNVQKATRLEHIIVTRIADFLPFPKNLLYPFVQKKQTNLVVNVSESETIHLWKSVERESNAGVEVPCDPENDLALLQYTGGTTGFPKGVMLTHKNLVSNTLMGAHWLYNCKEGEEVILGVLPFFHVYGMTAVMNLSIMQGYKMVLIPKFDMKMVFEAIKKHKVTLFPGAPTIYIALLNSPLLKEYDISSIQACISGSAPLPVEVQEEFERVTGGKLVEGYGLTESSPVTHGNFLWEKRVPGSIGVPWPDTEAIIMSLETGEALPPGEIGEIVVKGPQIMKGYWNKPEETAAVLQDGWLHTGDVGYMDEDGFFYVKDRKKDMIVASGFNVYPREVEEVLYECEKVQEVVTIGVPDPYRGETVKAFVVLKEGAECTEEELDQFARKYLAAYKVPKVYEFRSELPKTTVGKILRRVLIDEEKRKNEDEQTG
ncbi:MULTISPECIES: long-chain-fatty-acid--CoA ligase [Bacillus]|uniref:long-chain-fatty-acid--CoA ligase n=1 Tax=Bacillus TaxID=1386 RepID=UPI0002E4BB9E|nr:long-chain-fatty-acid--CoA ligase [Bacillus nitratireducens]EOP51094.1 acyl-CoA synthase [Bacillus cereus VDM053]MED0902948.1 long-chain-fatty-acid--CoA ligase [Bacillus nitratireducens]OJD41234.1 long-chain fatty acid--CoA ligase [Bacillus nitratireducens]QUG85903.1 long-chain-fatty-acid--CoA ligase [Bacillus nitratireducens]UNP75689.1 long-chain-fatty-acid--CoA ligase [Bacillus nitratireducens]